MNKTFILVLLALSLYISQVEAGGYCYFKYCPKGQKLNRKTCECECKEECPDNKKQLDDCSCVCDPLPTCTAPQDQFNEETCQCECPAFDCTAPKTEKNLDTCTCQCPAFECTDPKSQKNNDTCECECPDGSDDCLPNFVFNGDNCQCECPITAESCGPLEVFNEAQCLCVPLIIEECNDKQVLECKCVCDPAHTCDGEFVKNPVTCECECPLTQADCGDDAILNEQLCTCIPNIVDCPDGQEEQDGECVCIPKKCGPWKTQDPETCECVKCPRKKCGKGYRWSSYKCGCVKSYYGYGGFGGW